MVCSLLMLPFLLGFCVRSMYCFILQYFVYFVGLQSSRWGRDLVALLLLRSECHIKVIVL